MRRQLRALTCPIESVCTRKQLFGFFNHFDQLDEFVLLKNVIEKIYVGEGEDNFLK